MAVPDDEQLMRTRLRVVDGAPVLEVRGEIDVLTAHRLQSEVAAALDHAGPEPLVVDLTEVSFLGSHGITALCAAARAARLRSEALRLVVDENRPVVVPLQISGLDAELALYDSVDDALVGPTR